MALTVSWGRVRTEENVTTIGLCSHDVEIGTLTIFPFSATNRTWGVRVRIPCVYLNLATLNVAGDLQSLNETASRLFRLANLELRA